MDSSGGGMMDALFLGAVGLLTVLSLLLLVGCHRLEGK
jgi:hypothetical protein